MWTHICLRTARAMVSFPSEFLMTALTLGLDLEQVTIGMLKIGGKGTLHPGKDTAPGSPEVGMVPGGKREGMMEFPL